MDDQTYAAVMVDAFRSRPGGPLFASLFDILIEQGLKPHASENSKTLLFKWFDSKGAAHNLIAFRREPSKVLSFPKSFWPSHRAQFEALCQPFDFIRERPPVGSGGGPSTKESYGQIQVSPATINRLQILCAEAVRYAQSLDA